MHYHLEIILPPSAAEDIETAVEQVMQPFSETQSELDEDGNANYNLIHAFYDWYVIGGRWDRTKTIDYLDKEKVEAFEAELSEMKVTVSSVQCGAQELSPVSQIPKVDALWKKFFPQWEGSCPFFQHGKASQYDNAINWPNVMRVDRIPEELSAVHVIIAGNKNWHREGEPVVYASQSRYLTEVWLGDNFLKTEWDGNVKSAIEMHNARLNNYKGEYKEEFTVQGNWLTVTIDYHS